MKGNAKAKRLIKDIVDKTVAAYQPQKIILFGSYAYGRPDADSDIDLLIITETGDRFLDHWMTVRRIVSDLKCTMAVDTIVLTPDEVAQRMSMQDQVLAEILTKGQVFYAA